METAVEAGEQVVLEGKATFIGSEVRSVDEKGRSPIPRKFRRVLDAHGIDELILAPVQEAKLHAIRVYPPALWQRIADKLVEQDLSASGDAVAWLFRAESEPCELDSAGRILIPAKHRKRLGLGSEVVWAGQGPFIDLLDPEWLRRIEELPAEERMAGAEEIRKTLRGG